MSNSATVEMQSHNASAQTPPEGISFLQPSVTFESITFSDGTTISLEADDIVVFVGPNNAGKSAALRELDNFTGTQQPRKVIASSKLRRIGTAEDLHAYLERTSFRTNGSPGTGNFSYQGYRYNISHGMVASSWNNNLFANLPGLFCLHIATTSRITGSDPTQSYDALNNAPGLPMHLLYADDKLELRLSEYFRRAFNIDLILYRVGGNQLPLLVGERLAPKQEENHLSSAYWKRVVASTQPLQSQGDGMRSFVSVILNLLTPHSPSVLLIDEPEAFLHPPQARLLGEIIAKVKPEGSQLFLATHSPDVLQGLLAVAGNNLRIIRIQRDGSINKVKELDKAKAKEISNDPLMKYTSVLSGIFHQRVIICEADSDCLFYSSILDIPTVRGEFHPDVLFIHANGKHRMAALASSLKALGVNVDVIADIDILNDEAILERLIIALNGDWGILKTDAIPLKKAIEQQNPALNASEVVKNIEKVLANVTGKDQFPKTSRNEIELVFRKASPWDAIKSAGKAAIPAGQPTKHFSKLQTACNKIGLWIAPVGEMENFCKSEGNHGPAWVQQVLTKYDIAKDPEFLEARKFVKKVWDQDYV